MTKAVVVKSIKMVGALIIAQAIIAKLEQRHLKSEG